MNRPTEPPADRFCDLIMKGGVTSGVVYPKAVAKLAERYRFRSIGGTSAGAIVAALTAAAEFNRRMTNTRSGFEMLAGLPNELQETVPGTKRSRLLGLFQAQPATKRLFSTLVFALNRQGSYRRIGSILAGLVRAYWPATLASLLAALAVFLFGGGWLAAVLLFPLALLLSVGSWVYRDITRAIPENGFGLCSGLTADAGSDALTPWLHQRIQRAAGLGPDDPPLTFGQLWKAPGIPAWLKSAAPDMRSIDLQMFTTNLAHGRPYIFPLASDGNSAATARNRERLFFCPRELARYLPADVVAWITAHAQPYRVDQKRMAWEPPEAEAAALELLELPLSKDLPVILATRMSLSFPLLLSAIPLWAINRDAPEGQRHFHRCWFSDGGISSNFPAHLFDGLLPLWPTFGISLEPEIDQNRLYYLPKKYSEGYGERWNLFADNPAPASRFGGFISAILQTMQSWNDTSLARMPGVRDRIVRVRLRAGEGGMNLNMPAATLDEVSKRGIDAANELLQRFDSMPDGAGAAEGWDEQRFVRLGVLLNMLETRKLDIAQALDPAARYATDFDTLIERAIRQADPAESPEIPPGYEAPLTPEQARSLQEAYARLKQFAGNGSAAISDFNAIPTPELRVRPPL